MENKDCLAGHRVLIKFNCGIKDVLLNEVSPDGKYVRFKHPEYGRVTWEPASAVISDLGLKPKTKGFFS
jgi:hypothetical protein